MRFARKKKEESSRPNDKPPDEFLDFWLPIGTEEPSGASWGGHPDAVRIWARHDPGRYVRKTYGIDAVTAWSCACYREEFQAWKDAGKPALTFVSICLPLHEQAERWAILKAAASVKKLPAPMPHDYDVQAKPIDF